MLDVCYKSSAILHVDIAQTSDSFEGKHSAFDLETLLGKSLKPIFYNPGQNYLRKFSPSCPFSYATKLFPKRRLCGKKTPSPNSMLLPTNAQGLGFLLNAQQHCFQGKGEREEPVQLRRLEKCCPSIQFSQQFCPRLCTR